MPFRSTTAVGSREHEEYVKIVMPGWLKAREAKEKMKAQKRKALDHAE